MRREAKGLLEAAEARSSSREAQREAALDLRTRKEDSLDRARVAKKADYAQRTADLQLVMESKGSVDVGKRRMQLEPPPKGALWSKGAPPHQVSHWSTIMGQYNDPAPRSHEKFIVSYAKSFPGIENRPDTPHQPAWGGSRDPKVDSKMWCAE